MASEKSVVVSAEPYGYGPASKLGALASELAARGNRVHFFGTGTAAEFARANADRFASITELEDMAGLAQVDPHEYDAAVSVMDPYLPVWAAHHGISCAYVDSLFWIWEWPGQQRPVWDRVGADIAAKGSVVSALAEMARVPMHSSQYLAHRMASVSCVQQIPGVPDRAVAFGGPGEVVLVEAIIDRSERAAVPRELWLASSSGLLNDLVPLQSAVAWTEDVVLLLESALYESGSELPLVVAGNPDVLECCTAPKSCAVELRPMPHRELLSTMNRAAGCLTPPGLTTLLEAAAYGVPSIMLPAQHYGHLLNYRRIAGADGSTSFPDSMVPGTLDHSGADIGRVTGSVLAALSELRRSPGGGWDSLVTKLAAAMHTAEAEPDHLARAQHEAVRDLVGGFDGVRQVADVVEKL